MCCGTTHSNTASLSLLAIHSSLGTSHVLMTSSLQGPTFALILVNLIQTPDLHNCMKSRLCNCPHQVYLRVLTDAYRASKMFPYIFPFSQPLFSKLTLPSHTISCPPCCGFSLTAPHAWVWTPSFLRNISK